MKETTEINEQWELKALGEVCKLKNGFAFKSTEYKKEGIPVIRISDIKGGSVLSEKSVRVDADAEFENYLVKPNDILVAMSGATTGKFGIYKGKEKAYQNQRVGKFQINNKSKLDNNFLLYQLHALKRRIEKDAYGGAQPNISSGKIEAMEILLPPVAQQQQIVSKIEELFSELDKGIEELKTAQQQLKVYRQAVLKWAFEGKLTNTDVKEGELPRGWNVEPLGKLMESVRNGYSKKPDDAGDYKILRISSVRPTNVDVNEVRSLLHDAGDDNSVTENDLLFTRYNGSIDFVGVCGRVPKLASRLFYPDKLIRCRPLIKEAYHSAYLEYASNYGSARKFVLSRIKTTAGQTGISGSDLKQIPIPIAPLEEQQQIVQEIESRLSVCDKIEETITNSLKQSEALRQSILKKAFEGSLA